MLLRKIYDFVVFVATGIITIVVGSFMLRGAMRLWDSDSDDNNDESGVNK